MKNPTRRNRNIGTSKQGHGSDNALVVPYPAMAMKSFFERLGTYKKVKKNINGHPFTFVVEETRENSFHACSVEDLEKIIGHIPKEDYGDLELIILRQPTRKEETLHPVWGRMIYSYEFEGDYLPAVIIEATSLDRRFKWPKKLSIDSQRELERLQKDGHKLIMGKRHFEGPLELKHIRSTQLYRTLPHEFGHYVHYLEIVERPGNEDEEYEEWEKRSDHYFRLPSSEKEAYAHSYAERIRKDLEKKELIPFNRILDKHVLCEQNLRVEDFIDTLD